MKVDSSRMRPVIDWGAPCCIEGCSDPPHHFGIGFVEVSFVSTGDRWKTETTGSVSLRPSQGQPLGAPKGNLCRSHGARLLGK